MNPAPTLRIRRIELFERAVVLRLPFRFGAATVTHCPQAFVRVQAEIGGRTLHGASAELMVPKWFDKSPALTHEQNFEQLREALRNAREALRSEQGTAWLLSQGAGAAAMQASMARGLPRLAAQFGPALLDKAVADAVLQATERSWCDGVPAGLLGDPYAARLRWTRPEAVWLRHTVGLADRLTSDDPGADPADGLPSTLAEAIARHGLQRFKLKLCGRADEDLARLARIATVLQSAGDWRVTLDGNESFADAQTLADFWQRLRQAAAQNPALAELHRRCLLLEQPLPRAITLRTPIDALGIDVPVILDESDDHDEAFDEGLALGYRGISSKACKGLYRALRNAALQQSRPGLLLSGEDLTCQAGLAVQQDTLLAASLGVEHIERNGHHYVDGFGAAPAAEAEAFAAAHPGLYEHTPAAGGASRVRLRVHGGRLDLRSLHGTGFAHAVDPQWADLDPMN